MLLSRKLVYNGKNTNTFYISFLCYRYIVFFICDKNFVENKFAIKIISIINKIIIQQLLFTCYDSLHIVIFY